MFWLFVSALLFGGALILAGLLGKDIDASHHHDVMGDAGLRERMGKAGRLRAVEKFSWKAIAQQTRDLYASLVRR